MSRHREDRHSRPTAAAHPHARAIKAHVARHIGRVSRVFRGLGAESPQLDVLYVAPVKARPLHTLVTSGMSAVPMQAPADTEAPLRLELGITLPEYWQLDDEALQDEVWRWPLDLLIHVARFPHRSNSLLAWGDVVPHGEPPRPLASDTRLCGAIVAPSLLVPPEFYQLQAGAHSIVFYAVIPLYLEEMELRRRAGMEPLLTRLIEQGTRDLVNPQRRNVAVTQRRFRLFGR